MKIPSIILFLLVLGSSILVWPGLADNVQTPRLFWWALCLILIAVTSLLRNDGLKSLNILSPVGAWAVYTAFSIIAMLLSDRPMESIIDISRSILFLFFLVFLTDWLGRDFRLRLHIAVPVTVATFIMLLAVLFQYLLLPEAADASEYFLRLYQITGFSGHKTMLSAYLVVGLPFVFYVSLRSKGLLRILAWLVLMFATVTILYLQSRAAWLGLILILVIMMVILLRQPQGTGRRRLFLIPLSAVFILIACSLFWIKSEDEQARVLDFQKNRLFQMENQDGRSRLSIWEATLELCMDYPVVGVGPGQWRIAIPPYQTAFEMELFNKGDRTGFQTWHRPHQDLLWVWSEKGLPGLIAYIGFWVLLILKAVKRILVPHRKDGLLPSFAGVSIVVYSIFALVSFPSERFDIQTLVLLAAAILGSKLERGGKKKVPDFRLSRGVVWVALLSGLLIITYAIDVFRIQRIHGKYVELVPELQRDDGVRRNWVKALGSPLAGLDPFAIPYSFYPAMLCYREKNWHCSREWLDKALECHPNQLKVLTASALQYYRQGDLTSALRDADRALAIFPEYDDALVIKTRTLEALRQSDEMD